MSVDTGQGTSDLGSLVFAALERAFIDERHEVAELLLLALEAMVTHAAGNRDRVVCEVRLERAYLALASAAFSASRH